MTQIDLEEWLTSSQGDIPASPSRQPGSAEAIKMTDTSGLKCLELSKLSGPAGSLERMLLATSLWASTRCYLTWKPQATPAGATLYRLSPQMPRTDATDAGLWATPSAAYSVGTTGGGQGKSLRTDVRMWPTPTAHNAKEGGYPAEYTRNTPTLTAVATASETGLWPTPDTRGFTNDGSLMMLAEKTENRAEWDAMSYRVGPKQKNRIWPTDDPKATEKSRNSSGSLNPNWVEWLMGYPVGYTDLNS